MSFVEDMVRIVDGKLLGTNTAMPGIITAYVAPRASVQPSVKIKYEDGSIVVPPVIPNVPIVLPRTAAGGVTFPVAVGDSVLLIFSQRSIERWLSEGGLVEAGDARMHSMSDAFAIPGALSFNNTPTAQTGTVLFNGATKVRLADGKVAIGNSGAEFLDKVASALEATATSNCVNGAPLTNSAQIAADAASIRALQGSL